MSSHLFVDESKEHDYLLVASVQVSGELDDLRKLMRGLVLRGQRRVHMKKESDPRRRAIAAAICGAGVTATVYDAGQRYRDELDARAACLRGLVEDAAGRGDTLLVIEQDDSLLDWDRRQLYARAREAPPAAPALRTPRSSCSPSLTRSPGAGPRAATGAAGSSPQSPPCDRSDRSRTARNPAHQPSGWLPGSLPRS